jgi:hypothetical protein
MLSFEIPPWKLGYSCVVTENTIKRQAARSIKAIKSGRLAAGEHQEPLLPTVGTTDYFSAGTGFV